MLRLRWVGLALVGLALVVGSGSGHGKLTPALNASSVQEELIGLRSPSPVWGPWPASPSFWHPKPGTWDLSLQIGPVPIASPPEALQTLMDAAARIRQLRFRHRLVTKTLTDETLRQLLETDRKEQARRYQASEKVLQLLGLLEAGQSLWPLLEDLYRNQVVGVYDPRTRTLFWRQDVRGFTERLIIVHELAHALVDQNLDLASYLYGREVQQDGEARMARQAVAEGDATLVMLQYWMETMNLDTTSLADLLGADPETMDQLLEILADLPVGDARYPPWLVRLFVAPYIDGLRLVLAAFRRDGWAGVNDLYRRPPADTSQLLHPERYFQDRPGRPVPPPMWVDGKVFDRDRVGELSWLVWLEHFTDRPTAAQAADGWDGDMSVLVQTDPQGWTWQAVTRWASEKDAQEFEQAVRQAMDRRLRADRVLPIRWAVRRAGRTVHFRIATP
ncbi:MAG: hypothetical protein NZ742_01355 [Acidobacteria bacterium]|nr:hypothetical protein [Acidobacteriota bacterium]MDW7983333.1 hypothetical protein [Acidobacteriota bacterium]